MTDERPTLALLLDGLGLGLVRVLAAPKGLDVLAGPPSIHDPADPSPLDEGAVVLAVGVRPEGRDALELLDRAALAAAAAVVVKAADDVPTTVVDAAEGAGVALLAIPPEMEWGQVHALLRSVAAAGPPGEDVAVPIGDLFALANAVAAMVGGATTIEDRQSNLLAYSTGQHRIDEPRRQTILGRRVSAEWIDRLQTDGVFRRLWATDDVLRIEYAELPNYAPRLAVAVRAGDEILGSIWVVEGDRPLGAEAERALREAGRIAALHLLRHRSSDALERRHRSELLRGALEGRVPPPVLASPLGLAPTEGVAVLAFELVSAGEGADLEARIDRAVDLVAFAAEAHRRTAMCASIGRRIYALVPRGGDLRSFARAVAERCEESLRLDVRVGVGSTVPGLVHLARSRTEADVVLRVLTETGGTIATLDDVRPRALLHRLRDLSAAEPDLLSGKVALLGESDAERRTEYLPTLRAYLDAFGDVRRAADELHVHPNTFRYRLRRLTALADLDLEDPIERLVTHLQLHLRDGGPTP